jgi:hypothetical protein
LENTRVPPDFAGVGVVDQDRLTILFDPSIITA